MGLPVDEDEDEASPTPRKARRSVKPAQTIANVYIKKVFGDAVPDRNQMTDTQFAKAVHAALPDHLNDLSRDTILRAAGRKK